MDHARKVAAMKRHLPALGIEENMFAPPLYKLFWALGWELTPPVFAGRGHLFVLGTVIGVVMFALLGWLVPLPLEAKIAARYGFWVLPIALGLLTGALSAWWVPNKFKRYGLPDWADYRGDQIA